MRQRRLHTLETACRRLTAAGRFADALEAGLAAVAVEPLRESSHAAVIEAHLAEGNLIEASRQYEQLRDLLREHLGTRHVADHLDERRLHGLVAIGCEEISYRRGQRYLTSVVDHHSGAIVWCAPGPNAATLQAFFDLLGDRKHWIRAVSIDMSGGYEKAIRDNVPGAEVCFDPFHVVRLAQRAVDQVRRDEWNAHERSTTPTGKWIKNTRWSLLKAPAKQTIPQLAVLGEVQHANKPMFRAFLLKEELRLLYQLEDPDLAPAHLDAWLARASRSRLQPFIKLARTIRRHRAGILSAIRLGLSNGRLEGLNSRIRLISHRSFGFHSAGPLIALVYLCCTAILIDLPR